MKNMDIICRLGFETVTSQIWRRNAVHSIAMLHLSSKDCGKFTLKPDIDTFTFLNLFASCSHSSHPWDVILCVTLKKKCVCAQACVCVCDVFKKHIPPTVTLATMCSIYRVGVLLPSSNDISYISEIFLLNFLRQLYNHHFFPPQNTMYFMMLSCLVLQIFTFYIKSALKFKCPNSWPKG